MTSITRFLTTVEFIEQRLLQLTHSKVNKLRPTLLTHLKSQFQHSSCHSHFGHASYASFSLALGPDFLRLITLWIASCGRAPNRGYPRGLTIKHQHLSFGCRLRCEHFLEPGANRKLPKLHKGWVWHVVRGRNIFFGQIICSLQFGRAAQHLPHTGVSKSAELQNASRMLRKLQKSCWSSGLPLFFAGLCLNFRNHHCFSSWWILQNFYVGSKPFILITWSLPCQRICPTKFILHFEQPECFEWMQPETCEAGISTLKAALPSCSSLNWMSQNTAVMMLYEQVGYLWALFSAVKCSYLTQKLGLEYELPVTLRSFGGTFSLSSA